MPQSLQTAKAAATFSVHPAPPNPLLPASLQVAMVGSGAWASAAVRMVAQNTMGAKSGAMFQDKVSMWVRAGIYEVRHATVLMGLNGLLFSA